MVIAYEWLPDSTRKVTGMQCSMGSSFKEQVQFPSTHFQKPKLSA